MGKRLLVLDDEQMIEQMIQVHLQRQGYEHVSFNDPIKAMAFFRQNYKGIDLAIIDLTMPAMTGGQVAQEMCEIAPTLPVILLTGRLEANVDGNVNKIIHKPFTKQELIEAVEKLIGPPVGKKAV